ncbi:MAG TPA: alpha/beta hydrolase-fold protein [Gemmatimonadaceae bacterium]
MRSAVLGSDGKLRARPRRPDRTLGPGRHALGLEKGRDGLVRIPRDYRPEVAAPLVVMLHGAGSGAERGLRPFESLADEHGLVLLAPDSRRASWDLRYGGYGADVSFIDRALAWVFRHCAIDAARVAVAGFSDGASYALALGITNGDLFRRIVAFSPGFLVISQPAGTPAVYVSHGTDDRVLPIDRCSRLIVPKLREAGYAVEYKEFDGGHVVPPAIAAEAAAWLG